MIPETTQSYYDKKSEIIKELFLNKVKENIDGYEPFIRVGVTKSMIRVKYEHDLENKGVNYFEDIIDMVVEESLESLIYSSIVKSKISKEVDMYLSNHMRKSSIDEIREYLDYVSNFKFINDTIKQIDSIKYLYYGDPHNTFIHQIRDEFKNIKMFYIENLEDIYMSNSPVIDLNTVEIKYNEYIKKEYDDLYPVDTLYEEINPEFKRGVITLNCYLGDIQMLKVNTIFGNGKVFMRKLKLSRILKY